MKTLLLTLVSIFAVSITGFSQSLLLNDDFTSANGTALTAASPAWTQAIAGVNIIKIATVDSSSMTSFSGYTGSGTGNAVLLKQTGQDVSRGLSSTQTNGSTVYASFILNATSTTTTGDYFFNFYNGNNHGGRVYLKTNGAGFNIGIQVGFTAPPTYSSTVYSLNTNYLVVVKYQLIAGSSNDIASVFVIPAGPIPSIEPLATATAPLTSEAIPITGILGVLLRQGGAGIGPTLLVDGLRVSNDWATAVNSNVNASPALTSPVSSLISSTTATLGASLTSYGWVSSVGNDATVTERGIVWSTSPAPTTLENKVSGGTGINFTVPVTGLPAGTKVYYRGYAINANGTSYTATDGVIFTEPAAHVTGFGGSVISSSAVDLNWTPVLDAAGYLILSKAGSDPTGLPTDATAYSAGNPIGDATVRAVVMGSSSSSVSLTGLPTANLYFQIIPFGYDGSLPSTYNYKTDETIPVTIQSTILGTSDLVATSGFSFAENIAYKNYQSTDISSSNSVDVFGLTLRDGGSSLDDPDANPTVLTSLSLSVSNPSILRQAALYDGTTELAEVTVSGSPLVFTGFTASAADGGTLNLTLKVSYLSTVADNTQNQFTVTDVTSQAGSSGFATSDGSGATSSISGDANRIEVSASSLSLVSQPANNSTFYVNSIWGTPIVLHTLDSNGNLDVDFNSLVTASPNGSGLLSGNSVSGSSGVVTFSSLSHNTVEVIELSVSSPGLASVVTNSFFVLSALQPINSVETFVNVVGTAPNYTGYDNSGNWTYTLTAGVVVGATNVSSGYAGASGGKNLNFSTLNGVRSVTLSGINTSAYNNLTFSFGYRQASILANAGVTTIEWSSDGVTYNPISLASYLPSGSGWTLISNVPLPSGAMTSNLRIRVKVDYSATSGGIQIDDLKLQGSNPFATEPTTASSAFSVTNLTNISFTANWVNGDGQKRIVVAKQNAPVDGLPVDAVSYTANSSFGSGSQIGSGNYVVYSGTGTSVSLSNLVQGENYQFAVVDYNGSGASTNYLTSSVLTGSQTTINAAYALSSDVVFVESSESATISSVSNEVGPLTSTQGAQVLQFTVRDGGESADFDVLPTKVDSIVFTHGTTNQVSDWRNRIKSADLFDGSTHLSSAVVDSAKITFAPVAPLSIADGTSKTFSVRVSLKSEGLIDNQELGFALLSTNITSLTDASSSGFTELTPFETVAGKNVISVTASALAFSVEPGSLNKKGTTVSPSPEVRTVDANGNLDTDYTSAIVISSATTLDGAATISVPATAGVSVFSNLIFSGTGSETALTATSGSLTQATSSSINVYEVAAEPTVSASVLSFSTVGNQSFKLTFNKGNGASRLVVARKNQAVNLAPADEQSYTGNSVFGTGTDLGLGNYIISAGSDTSFFVTGLEPDSTYYFEIFEFNGSNLTANYQASGLTGSNQTLNVAFASLSDAVIVSETESEFISSIVNSAGPLSSEDGSRIFDLEIRDGAGEADFDALPTIVDSIIVNASGYNEVSNWVNAIQTVSIFDENGTYLTDASIGENSLKFILPASLVIADNETSTLTFRMTLKSSGYTDNQSFGFVVSKSGLFVAESGVSSQTQNFAAVTTGATNKANVEATALVLVNQPGATGVSLSITPALVVNATDVYGNLDLDYSDNITVTATTTFGGSAVTVSTPESGIGTFASVQFDTENPNIKLTFSSGMLTEAVSDSFMVYPKSIPVAGEIVINQINGNYKESGSRFIELVNKTNKFFDLSELKLEFYSVNGVSADEPVLLSGILFPNRFWLLSNTGYIKTSLTDSVQSNGSLSSAIGSEGQIGLFKISGSTLLDGLGYGNVTASVVTETTSAETLTSGFTLSRTVAGNDSENNAADYSLLTEDATSIRNFDSHFFGSGSVVANATYSDIWFGGNATATTGFTVTKRLGLDAGIVSTNDGTVLIQNQAKVIDSMGWLENSITRNLNGNGAYSFPVGNATQSYKMLSEISQLPDAATNLVGTFVTGDPENAGFLPGGILSYWTGGSWALGSDGDNSTGAQDLTINVTALTAYIIEGAVENYVILQRADNASEWQLAGSSFIYAPNKITAVGVTGLGEFTIGEIDPESVPVEFTGLSVTADELGARLSWSTISEKNNQGFTIEKRISNKSWEVLGSVSGKGTTTEKQDYQFVDKLADEACEYRLSQSDFSGKVTLLGTVSFEGIARKFEVVGNYPNPFNPETIVLFRIPAEMKVKISVYNNLGQLVTVVKNEVMKAGSHEVKINADNLASGVYFYEVLAGNVNRSVKKMVLLK